MGNNNIKSRLLLCDHKKKTRKKDYKHTHKSLHTFVCKENEGKHKLDEGQTVAAKENKF